MKAASFAEMRHIDEVTQKQFGISADELMVHAGSAIARHARVRFAPKRVCVVCGKGNNAGDGFIAACQLQSMGCDVEVLTLSPPAGFVGAAARAYAQLDASGIRARFYGPGVLEPLLRQSDLVIDAILGIGAAGPARKPLSDAILGINAAQRPVLSVDVPSGLRQYGFEAREEQDSTPIPKTKAARSDQHEKGDDMPDVVIRATVTVTIGLPKLALLTMPGAEYAGEIIVEPIQFPRELLDNEGLPYNYATAEELAQWLPVRASDSNKGTFGRVGIVGGSAPFAGAAILMARAALRSGAGLVTIFTPRELNAIYKAALPEAVTVLVPSGDPDALDDSSAQSILEHSKRMDVLAVGPGLKTGDSQRTLISFLLASCEMPMVLDADAITCLSPVNHDEKGAEVSQALTDNRLRASLLAGRKDCVLTPHPGEMARITGSSISEIQRDRLTAAQRFSRVAGVNLLLKGASTVMARPDGQLWINPGGSSALAKAGTGDVLTGCIAALIAQKIEPWKAAVIAAHVHLQAGRLCASRRGHYGVLASEIADELSIVIQQLADLRHEAKY